MGAVCVKLERHGVPSAWRRRNRRTRTCAATHFYHRLIPGWALMKAYVITTALIFGLLTVAHVWRVMVEPNLLREPWHLLTTLIAAAIVVWASRLLWVAKPPRP